MYGQTSLMPTDPLPARRANSVTFADRWSGADGQLPGRPCSLRWKVERQDTTFTGAGRPDFPVITQSAGTRWNGSPAGRDFG